MADFPGRGSKTLFGGTSRAIGVRFWTFDSGAMDLDPELERFMVDLVYGQSFVGERNTSRVGNLHSEVGSGEESDGDSATGAKSFTSAKTQTFLRAKIVQGSYTCNARDISCAPQRFSASSDYRGDAFHISLDGKRVVDKTFYSGGAFEPILGLYEISFEARPIQDRDREIQGMRVTRVIQLKCCPPTLANITRLLAYELDMSNKQVQDLLSLGGYDCVADRLRQEVVGEPRSELDEQNGVFDRATNLGQDAPVIPCTSLSAKPCRNAQGRTVNKALHKFELVRWLLERAEERLDPGKVTPAYRLGAFEAFYKQTSVAYKERMRPRELQDFQDQHEYGTGYTEGHKWRPGPPLSLRFARHPTTSRFFGASYFQRLSQYYSEEWLAGLRVEEIYGLHSALLCTHVDGVPEIRYSTLYRQCFSTMLEERRVAAPSLDTYRDLVYISYPHQYSGTRTRALPASELSYDNLADIWCAGDRVRRIVTAAEVVDVFVYFVIQRLHYAEKHTCAHVRDVVNHCLFEMNYTAAKPLVVHQKSAYNLTVPAKVAEREKRGNRLRADILKEPDDPVRLILDSLEALVRIGAVRVNGHLDSELCLSPFPIRVKSCIDLERDGACTVYLDRVHKIHRTIVYCMDELTRRHADRAARGSLPPVRRFFVEAEKRGWSLERQRSVADRLNRMSTEEVEEVVVGRMLGDEGFSDQDLTEEGSEHLALAGNVETPVHVPRFELCSEQRLAQHCIDTQAVTNIYGAPGSGKSEVVANLYRRYSTKKGRVVGLAFMGAHINSLRKTISIQDDTPLPLLTVHQFLRWHEMTCLNEPGLVDDALAARLRMAKQLRGAPFFGDLCYPEPCYGTCPLSFLHTVHVEEFGVVYEELFARLVATINRCAPNSCRLVTTGGLDQLPPISPGCIARELMIGFGVVPMEHGHRFDKLNLVKLGRAIVAGNIEKIEIDDGGESISFFPCSMRWRSPESMELDPVNVVEGLYRSGAANYYDSMVICATNKLAAKLAHHIDSWHLLEEAKKRGSAAVHRLLRFYNKVEDGREAARYGRPLLWRNCYFPGQKIIFGRNVPTMGLTNKEQLVITSIVEGDYVHLEDETLASIYKQVFGEVCKEIRELASSVTEEDTDASPSVFQKLAAHYRRLSEADAGKASNFVQIVRNHFYQGLKAYTKAQAEAQSLQGQALLRYEAMNFHRKEVHALKYGAGTGYSPLHRNPLCHRRRTGESVRTDDVVQAELLAFMRRELQPPSSDASDPKMIAALEEVILNALRDVMSDLCVEANMDYECSVAKLVEDATSIRHVHPNHAALSVAVQNQYRERNVKNKKVGPDDYIVFTPIASLAHTRAYSTRGRKADTLRFIQCHALGDEKRIVFIPIIKDFMDIISGAAAITTYAAQGSSASKAVWVMPSPEHTEDFAMACTRAEDCCILVSNDFALLNTVKRRHHARMSYLGAELRTRCLIPRLRSADRSGRLLEEIRAAAVQETAVARRPDESRSRRNLRVSAFHKEYALSMPHDSPLPLLSLGPNNTDWVLDKMQDVFPYLLFDRSTGAPVNALVTEEEYAQEEYEYLYVPYDEADTLEGELSDSEDDMDLS